MVYLVESSVKDGVSGCVFMVFMRWGSAFRSASAAVGIPVPCGQSATLGAGL